MNKEDTNFYMSILGLVVSIIVLIMGGIMKHTILLLCGALFSLISLFFVVKYLSTKIVQDNVLDAI